MMTQEPNIQKMQTTTPQLGTTSAVSTGLAFVDNSRGRPSGGLTSEKSVGFLISKSLGT
jgi:hypothetical protein